MCAVGGRVAGAQCPPESRKLSLVNNAPEQRQGLIWNVGNRGGSEAHTLTGLMMRLSKVF